VTPVPPAVGVPTGTVTVMDGATPLGVVTLGKGSASLTPSNLLPGTHSLPAVYSGSAGVAARTAPVRNQVRKNRAVTPGSTTTHLRPSPRSIKPAFCVTFTATVNPVPPASGVPTGTVTFSDGATVLGTVNVNATGQATLITRRLQSLGAHPVKATYNGD